MAIKWGIIGLGSIAHTFVADLLQVEGAVLFAVASRDQNKANDFAKTYGASYAYGNYVDLLKNPELDVVYIATPHVFHYENTLKALTHKKAVLCEKPLAMNATQVRAMQDLARENQVFFMEALWTDFMPAHQYLNTLNTQQTFGQLKYLKAEFCFEPKFEKNSRLFNKSLGGGSLLDIGIYPVYLAVKLLGQPDEIIAKALFNKTQVDVEGHIQFQYKNGAKADLFYSFLKTTDSEALIEYEGATVKLHQQFYQTDKLSISSPKDVVKKDFKHKHKGYNFEIEHVNFCLTNKLTESPLMSFKYSLDIIETLDRIREQIGLHYTS